MTVKREGCHDEYELMGIHRYHSDFSLGRDSDSFIETDKMLTLASIHCTFAS